MFKKLQLLAISLLLSTAAFAETTVPVYWPFSLASTHATMVRTVVEELNTAQKDYTFVFVHKPGAGGSIAANTLINHNGPALMAATSSFFIRPNLYPSASHDLSKYNTLGSYCDAQPLALISSKYKTLDEIKNQSVTIGVIPGSITHLTAISYNSTKPVSMVTAFYQGTPEITKDVIGGHLDISVDFLSSAVQFQDRLHVLAISGSKNYPEGQTFKSQGVHNIEGTHANFLMYTPDADPTFIKLTRQALAKVLQSSKLQETCRLEYGTPVTKVLAPNEAADLYNKQVTFWRKQANGLVIEK